MNSKYKNSKLGNVRKKKTGKNLDDNFDWTPVHYPSYMKICEGSSFQPRNTAGDGFLNSLSVCFGYF